MGCPNIDVCGAFAEPKIDCDGFTVLSTLEIFAKIDVEEDAVVLSPKAGPCELDTITDGEGFVVVVILTAGPNADVDEVTVVLPKAEAPDDPNIEPVVVVVQIPVPNIDEVD